MFIFLHAGVCSSVWASVHETPGKDKPHRKTVCEKPKFLTLCPIRVRPYAYPQLRSVAACFWQLPWRLSLSLKHHSSMHPLLKNVKFVTITVLEFEEDYVDVVKREFDDCFWLFVILYILLDTFKKMKLFKCVCFKVQYWKTYKTINAKL